MSQQNFHSAEDLNAAVPRALAGRMMSILFVLSGLVTLGSSFLPSVPVLTRTGVLGVGLASVVVGVIVWWLPWQRWPRSAMLWFVPLAFLLICLHNLFSGADPYRYSVFFLVTFTWLGMAQPRGTSLSFIPFFVLSYVTPLWIIGRSTDATSVLYILPVCVCVSESLAWVSARLRKVQLALFQSEARFRSLVQHASDMVIITDADSTIRYLSPSVERILGYGQQALLRTKLSDLFHPADLAHVRAAFEQVLRQADSTISIECRVRHHDESWRYIEATSTNLLENEGVQGIVLNSRDITERKLLEEQLMHQAFHDPLTGLVNRAAFSDRVDHALTRVDRNGTTLAVLFLDLDNFKTINDSFGHAVGDQVLVTIAGRLSECLRASDVAARLGGDEFAILLEDVSDTNSVTQVADRLLETLGEPLVISRQSLSVGVSIGIAWSRPGQSAADLLRHADMAMYSVKHTGKGYYAIFDPKSHLVGEHTDMLLDLPSVLS